MLVGKKRRQSAAGDAADQVGQADERFPGTGKLKLCRESRIFPIGGPLCS
jgi:hypothetical protein